MKKDDDDFYDFNFGLKENEEDRIMIRELRKNKSIKSLILEMKKAKFPLNPSSEEIRSVLMHCIDFYALQAESIVDTPRKKSKSPRLGVLELGNKYLS